MIGHKRAGLRYANYASIHDSIMTAGPAACLSVESIFRSEYDWLQRWVRRRAPACHMSEDVAAETMLRMVDIAGREAIREPRAMMTLIAKRILYDLRARNDLHRAYEEAIANLPAMLEPSPEEQLIVKEALARIENILRGLSIKARSAFLLSQVDGLRHAEIAGMLGVSVSMVRKYIGQAMRACYQDSAVYE